MRKKGGREGGRERGRERKRGKEREGGRERGEKGKGIGRRREEEVGIETTGCFDVLIR